MNRDVLKQVAQYNKERRRKTRRYKALGALAAVVVFCTTYALILPAATMEHDPVCGYEEHVHDESCYAEVLTCTLEESEGGGHVHDESCYTVELQSEEVLTCTESEGGGHTHDSGCYTTETVTETVTRTVTETVTEYEDQEYIDENGETVTESVPVEREISYDVEEEVETEVEVLTCTETESEGHTHDSGCYETVETEVEVLTCTETESESEGHTHDSSCYETQLICGMEEHSHSDSCYPAAVETTPEPEETQVPDEGSEDQAPDEGSEDQDPVEGGEEETPEEPDQETPAEGETGEPEDGEQEGAEGPEVSAGDILDPVLENLPLTTLPEIQIALGNVWTLEGVYVNEDGWFTVHFDVLGYGEEPEDLELTVSGDSYGDLFSEYAALVGRETLMPLERLDFTVTAGGEPVDRALYDVTAAIVPSEDMLAYMESMSSAQSLDLPDGMEEAAPLIVLTAAVEAYERTEGELAELGRADSGDYVFEVAPSGNDFAVFVEVTEAPITLLDEIATTTTYLNQSWWWWNDRYDTRVWWAGFQPSGTGIEPGEAHISTVKLTTLNVKDGSAGTEYTIAEGDGTDKGTVQDTGVLLEEIFPDAEPKSNGKWETDGLQTSILEDRNRGEEFDKIDDGAYDYVECSEGEATHLRADLMQFGESVVFVDTGFVSRGSETWNTVEMAQEFGGAQNVKYYYQVFPSTPKSGHQHALLEITPDPGYYVAKVVITCCNNNTSDNWGWTYGNLPQNGNAYHDCNTFKAGDAFMSSFSVTKGESVSLVVDSEFFSHHGSVGNKYFIMIYTDEIPNPLYVQYDAGLMSGDPAFSSDAAWLAGGRTLTNDGGIVEPFSNTVDKLSTADNGPWTTRPSYNVAGISPEAIAAARAKGYRFTGWKLQYFNDCSVNSTNGTVTMSDPYNEDPIDIAPLATTDLTIYAKFVAQWEKIKGVSVTKVVTDLEDGAKDNEAREFQFEIQRLDETKDIWETVDEISIQVTGEGQESYTFDEMKAGTYRIAETDKCGATDTTYSVDGLDLDPSYAYAEFVVQEGKIPSQVVVTNSYADAGIATYTLDLKKVAGTRTTDSETGETTISLNKDLPLANAKFLLTSEEEEHELITAGKPDTSDYGTVTLESLSFGTEYTLTEKSAPNGYNLLKDEIKFTVNADGTFTPDVPEGAAYEMSFDEETNTLTLIVANIGGYTLPSTGGAGTCWYTLGGVLLITMAAAALVYKRPRGKEGRETI